MKKLILLATFFQLVICNLQLQAQSRMVINNNGYLVIDNSAFLVIDNSNANALAVAGTGGKIISEAENDRIKWNISTTTGAYSIPWSTSVATGAVKIPLSVTVTGAGVGAGNVIFSTYETSADNNTPWQSGITNMCSAITNADGSLFVADRFWQINANGYGTKPSVNMTIAYNPAANELVGTNTIVETNLQAQRFNAGYAATGPCYVGAGSWESLLFGTNNAASDNVTNIIVPAADFFKDWILVDNLSPLPIELVSFEANCKNGEVEIKWVTQSEINNDYFTVEKSYDAATFFEITKVQGAGNSSVTNYYSVIDPNPSTGVAYYRLKQVDFDGTTTYHNIASTNCNPNSFDVNQLVLNNNALSFNVSTTADEELIIYFYDYRGRLVANKKEMIVKGNNSIKLSNLNISTGIYMLSIIGEYNNYSTKLMNTKD